MQMTPDRALKSATRDQRFIAGYIEDARPLVRRDSLGRAWRWSSRISNRS